MAPAQLRSLPEKRCQRLPVPRARPAVGLSTSRRPEGPGRSAWPGTGSTDHRLWQENKPWASDPAKRRDGCEGPFP